MNILGIDPSINNLGWSVITTSHQYKASGTLCTNAKEDVPTRLFKLYSKIEEFIKLYNPSVIALEKVFLQNDLNAVFKLSYVRGMIMTIIGKNNLTLVEVSPTDVKKNVAGNGRASKETIKDMIKHVVSIPQNIKIHTFDEADAIAIAYSASCKISFDSKIN